MDNFIRFLDLLHDAPTWAVAAGAIIFVLLPAWWLLRRLFRPSGRRAPAPSATPRATEAKRNDNGGERAKASFARTSAPVDTDPDNPAIAGFRRVLADKGVPPAEQAAMVREYAQQLNDARLRLGEIADADGDAAQMLNDVQAALDSGRFDDALEDLERLGEERTQKGRETRRHAERQLTAGTLARLVAGDLALAARDPETAERHYRLAIEALPSGSETLLAECLNKHGTAAYRADRLEVAAMSFRRAVKLLERLKGNQDGDVATALNNLAMLYYSRGDLNAAEPLYRRALAIDEATQGPASAAVATDLNNLALLLKHQNRAEEAEPMLKRALEIKETVLDAGHPSLLTGLRNYAAILRLVDREEEAAMYERRAAALSDGGDISDDEVGTDTDGAEQSQDRNRAAG
ncbi:MAG: tetratricopeptide repeat protein [Rhodospirillales bacterium]